MLPTDKPTQTLQNAKRRLNVIRYNSDIATINSMIKLEQNLFSFLLEGNKSVQYAGTKVTISPNQFFLLSAGNCLMSEKIAAPGGQYRSILFFFDNELLKDFFMRQPLQTNSVKSKHEEVPFLVFDKDAFLTNFIDSLGLMLASGQSLSHELQSVKLEELLVYINVRYPEVLSSLHHYSYGSHKDFLIRQAVTSNIYSDITVEELAFLCYMTLSTFKRHFAKLYGTSPKKWFIQKRMQKVAQMLMKSNCSLSEIYLEFGYGNLSSFIQSFKRIYGITPKQYRLRNLDV
jgi:AraC-like DNA-binding protein